jgi:dihydroorotase
VKSLVLRRPDDWHLHLRDGAALQAVAPFTAARFARAMIMPNLSPPITTTTLALAYRQRIMQALPKSAKFEPLMTLYLTDTTAAHEIDTARASGAIWGCKLYPAGATTHAASGVTDVKRIEAVLARMSDLDMVLQVHGEVTEPAVDVFDREARFIETVLAQLVQRFPALRIVLEHVSTRTGVQFVQEAHARVAATLTPQHLLLNRNALLAGGIRPHHYCMPILKSEADRVALVAAAVSGSPKFFLGTDSAPHGRLTKEAACGCAGVFSAHAALELYADIFEQAGALQRLQGFASEFGADFYGLPRNDEQVTLLRDPWSVAHSLPFGDDELIPFGAGTQMQWRMAS